MTFAATRLWAKYFRSEGCLKWVNRRCASADKWCDYVWTSIIPPLVEEKHHSTRGDSIIFILLYGRVDIAKVSNNNSQWGVFHEIGKQIITPTAAVSTLPFTYGVACWSPRAVEIFSVVRYSFFTYSYDLIYAAYMCSMGNWWASSLTFSQMV